MIRSIALRPLSPALGIGLATLAIAAGATFVAHVTDPLYVPLAVVAVLGGAVMVVRPFVGVLMMFAMVLFKPESLQGTISVNTLIAGALAGILLGTVLLTGRLDFAQSPVLWLFGVIGVVTVLNWVLVGSVEAPAHLTRLDHTGRALDRLVFQLAFLTFAIAFIRTRKQLLALTGVFVLGVFWTIPGALGRSFGAGSARSAEALRAAAVGGVQAAENANRLAFIALMAIVLIWFAMQRYRAPLVRLAGGGTVILLVITVLLSGSRSGFINLLLLPVLVLLQSRLRAGQVAAVGLVMLLGVTVAALVVPQPIIDRLLALTGATEGALRTAGESTSRRLLVLKAGLQYVGLDPILGVGIGNFRWMTAQDPTYGGLAMATHNAYLLALVEGGIPLLAAYLLLFWWAFRALNRMARWSASVPNDPCRWLVLATRTNLVLLLVFSLFAEAWKEFYFLFILASAAILAQIYRRNPIPA